MQAAHPPPIRVNRAPVLTLWAAVVAERLGHPPDAALTLGRAVASASAQAKARRLGIAEERSDEDHPPREDHGEASPARTVRLLGREVPVAAAKGGALVALDKGRPASPVGVRTYLTRAFGDRLDEVRRAMDELAASLAPDDLNRVGFRLYERFRPEVPEGVAGWGAKAELRVERIRRRRDDPAPFGAPAPAATNARAGGRSGRRRSDRSGIRARLRRVVPA
jgi:hypothetical protein